MTLKEPLLKQEENRWTLFPIKYPKMYEFFKNHEASFWTTEEINLKDDVIHWEDKLNDNERHFIKYVLAFFAASDGIVNENLVVNFYQKIQISEARAFYTVQMMMETIHSETYSVLIDTFIKDSLEKNKLFDSIQHIPVIKKKADWAIKYMELKSNESNSDYIFVKQLLSFIIVEGLFFSGSFCSIFWLKNKGLMPGLTFSNELISRDENLHCSFGIYLYSLVENKLSQKEVQQMIKDAVDIEKEFITEALPVSLIGLNCKTMCSYIEFVANKILTDLGYDKLYNVKECPFPFMELISFAGRNNKVNFFEKRNSNYQKSGVSSKIEKEDTLDFDMDF